MAETSLPRLTRILGDLLAASVRSPGNISRNAPECAGISRNAPE